MSKTVAMIGSFDTKGPEYAFLRERILARFPLSARSAQLARLVRAEAAGSTLADRDLSRR